MATTSSAEARIIEVLEAAGWESDGAMMPTLEYLNGKATLEIQKDFENDEIQFLMTAPDGTGFQLFLVYQDRLEEVLATLVALQKQIGPENYKVHLNQLATVCPEVYAFDAETEESSRLLPD